MAKFGDVFKGTDVKKTDSRPRSETRWLHYTKLIDNTDQYRKSATEEDIAAFAELIKSAGKVLQDLLVLSPALIHMRSLQDITGDLPVNTLWKLKDSKNLSSCHVR